MTNTAAITTMCEVHKLFQCCGMETVVSHEKSLRVCVNSVPPGVTTWTSLPVIKRQQMTMTLRFKHTQMSLHGYGYQYSKV